MLCKKLLSALGNAGRLSLTAVRDTPEEARAILEKARAVLDEEARFDPLQEFAVVRLIF
jgi:hypothetical protein